MIIERARKVKSTSLETSLVATRELFGILPISNNMIEHQEEKSSTLVPHMPPTPFLGVPFGCLVMGKERDRCTLACMAYGKILLMGGII